MRLSKYSFKLISYFTNDHHYEPPDSRSNKESLRLCPANTGARRDLKETGTFLPGQAYRYRQPEPSSLSKRRSHADHPLPVGKGPDSPDVGSDGEIAGGDGTGNFEIRFTCKEFFKQ